MRSTILTLGLYASSGGPAKSVSEFARALNGRVISWVDPLQYQRERLIWTETTLVHGSRLPLLRQLLFPQRRDLPEAEQFVAKSDLVSCHSFWRWHNIWLRDVARRHKVPFWFVPHGILDPYVFTYGRAAKQLFLHLGGNRFLREAAAVVCATRKEYEKLAHFFPGKPYAVIPWPLGEADFRMRDEDSRAATRASLGIPDDALALLYFGRLDPMKRPLETIDAVAKCRDGRCHLLIVGPEAGVRSEDCRRRAALHGLAQRVHIVGPAYGADKYAFIDACDVYISLSHRENFNFTAAECMGSGLPVILSAGNDLSYELANVGCGWMLGPGQAPESAIAEAAAVSSAERRDFGRAGQGWASTHLRRETFDQLVRAFAAELTA